MGAVIDKQMKDLDDQLAFFRQPILDGEFDWNKYQANKKIEEESKTNKSLEKNSWKIYEYLYIIIK